MNSDEKPRSLRGILLITMAALVIGSSLVVAVVSSQRYAASLEAALQAYAENQARALANQATDYVLLNDVVSLQRLLSREASSQKAIAYAFLIRNGQVLAHTFPRSVPADLVELQPPRDGETIVANHILSEAGQPIIDIAVPVMGGKAGVLRIGVDEQQRIQQVRQLWLEVGLVALGALILALGAGILLVRRITNPLSILVDATGKLDRGNLDVRVGSFKILELSRLADSFNHMASRLESHSQEMDKQAEDLERIHAQLSTAYEIIRDIAALPTLEDIGKHLLSKFKELLRCGSMDLLVCTPEGQSLNRITLDGIDSVLDCSERDTALDKLRQLPPFEVAKGKSIVPARLLSSGIADSPRQTVIPLQCDGKFSGALVLGCPGNCTCDFHESELISLVLAHTVGAISRAALQEEELRALRSRMAKESMFEGLVGKDDSMQTLYRLIEDVAPSDATVLIQGESGTGKELVAKAIHKRSPRADKPFVVINCSAYPDTLLESELFGHEKGAFTGAGKQRPGRFELADGGTVFLDEIGEIHPSAQVKLLRVLQTQKFERVGGAETIAVDVRIIAATNKNLLEEVKRDNFREDLYYRLDVVSITTPPLRDRVNDIALLCRHFLEKFRVEQSKNVESLSPQAMRLMMDYNWPGNVRELENVIEQAVVLARDSIIQLSDLPARLQAAQTPATPRRTIHENERRLLLQVLEEADWNKTIAAQRLGIGRSTLYAKLKKHAIDPPATADS